MHLPSEIVFAPNYQDFVLVSLVEISITKSYFVKCCSLRKMHQKKITPRSHEPQGVKNNGQIFFYAGFAFILHQSNRK
jgi:hypothetical protein